MNVILYMRYSSDKQTEQSIEGQRTVCAAFCKSQGYEIVGEYVDRAASAREADKRSEFQRMIRDSEKGNFTAVVVYKLDRFARNRYDSATYKAKLKKNGVRVISATENISDNPEGIILEAVLEGMAEFYSQELAQKVRRGRQESFNKGFSLGGTIPLGYKTVDKKYVIDEATAPVIREVFERYANGDRLINIARDLNMRGFRTVTGALFNKNSFTNMLHNEKYIGIYTYKGEKVKGVIPPIVDEETFNRVQRKIKFAAAAPAKNKAAEDYILTGKLFCGHCGAGIISDSGRNGRGKIYRYYSCANRKYKNICDKKLMPKDEIEYTVVNAALNIITPEKIDELVDMAVNAAKIEAETDTTIPAIEQELNEIAKKQNNLLKLIEAGAGSVEIVSERIAELDEIKKGIQLRLLEAKTKIFTLDAKAVKFWLKKCLQGDIHDAAFRRRVCDMLVQSVTVWDEDDGWKLTIRFNLQSETEITNRCSNFRAPVSPECANSNNLVWYERGCLCFTLTKKR